MGTQTVTIGTGFCEADRARVVEMLRAYEAALGVSLCFQGFEDEIRDLPAPYAPPDGAFIAARVAGRLEGFVGLRSIDAVSGTCEMKRLYVTPEARGHGLGRRLVAAVVDEARRLGYRAIRLDTLPMMATAQALYAEVGFRDIAPYYDNPIAGARYLELDLVPHGAPSP